VKKESILLLTLLTTSTVYCSAGESINRLEIDEIISEKKTQDIDLLTEILNRKPVNDEVQWQMKVDEIISKIYINQKARNSRQNPTCASVD
jgi:hypothetical protein